MKSNEQVIRDVSICNELLRRELAAVEIYSLATKLLDRDLDDPDYEGLLEKHRVRAERLIANVRELGGEPRSSEICWDRPHTAILCAATLYGCESPLLQLKEFEDEIVEAYENAIRLTDVSVALQSLLSEEFFVCARETQANMKAWSLVPFVASEMVYRQKARISQGSVA